MAGSRYHKTGKRYRSAKQRAQLRNAQLISARKRKRNIRVASGVAGIAAVGVAAGSGHRYAKSRKAGLAINNARSREIFEAGRIRDNVKKQVVLYQRPPVYNRGNRNVARPFEGNTKVYPGQLRKRGRVLIAKPGEAPRKADGYQVAYNVRRRAKYQAEVAGRPRKKRAKEINARKGYNRKPKED